jgi:hypothetical protein
MSDQDVIDAGHLLQKQLLAAGVNVIGVELGRQDMSPQLGPYNPNDSWAESPPFIRVLVALPTDAALVPAMFHGWPTQVVVTGREPYEPPPLL